MHVRVWTFDTACRPSNGRNPGQQGQYEVSS